MPRTHSRRRLGAIGVTALFLAAPAAALARSVVRGDWESVHGAAASFDVASSRGGGTVLQDVVVVVAFDKQYPKCNQTLQPASLPGQIKVSGSGKVAYDRRGGPPYPFSETLSGTITGASAHLTFREDVHNPTIFNTPPQCVTGNAHLTAAPGRRSAVRDGHWTGTASDGEAVSFSVGSGGREIVGQAPCHFAFIFGTWTMTSNTCKGTDHCSDFWAENMFISAPGTFGGTSGSSAQDNLLSVAGKFSGPAAVTGSWTDQAVSCQAQWTAAPG